jgi:endonuclease-8
MSEGPEVKIIANKILSQLKGKEIEDIIFKNLDSHTKNQIIGSKLEYVQAFGKNLVFKFSSGIYLRNHMMMWGKWRIYDRTKYDEGLATPPPRRSKINHYHLSPLIKEKDVRNDSRVRLTIITKDNVLIEFNGPILQFSMDNPVEKEPIKSLGPDCLNQPIFDVKEFEKRLLLPLTKQEILFISEALLNQKIIAGIGNKYKSEILFVCGINPFKKISQLDINEQNQLYEKIPKVLKYGYENAGRTRPLLKNEENSWSTRHWVFRRSGRECWICKTKIMSEKKLTARSTFWCPTCQQ